MKYFLCIVLIIASISLGANPSWETLFPKLDQDFTLKVPNPIVDIELDSHGNWYILHQDSDSLYIEIVNRRGKHKETYSCDLGVTPNPVVRDMTLSESGKILIIGSDYELTTPINWVLDENGEDILPAENVLKYAEWLQISPGGDFFTSQGYSNLSVFPDVYTSNWEKYQLEKRWIHHGYFIGLGDNGEDLLLMTETDTAGTGLALLALPSQEELFTEHLEPANSYLLPHRGRITAGKDILVMTLPENIGGKIYGLNRENGEILWTMDPTDRLVQLGTSFEGNKFAYIGDYCVQIIDNEGTELSLYCADYRKTNGPVFRPGIPTITFWEKYGLLMVNLSTPGSQIAARTIVMNFTQDWEATKFAPLNFTLKGFNTEKEDFLANARGKELEIYKIKP